MDWGALYGFMAFTVLITGLLIFARMMITHDFRVIQLKHQQKLDELDHKHQHELNLEIHKKMEEIG